MHLPRLETLTDQKFQEIYTDPKFRNEVAFAGTCLDKYSNFSHYKTISHPVEYIVTKEHIKLAQIEYERAKAEKIKSIQKGTIVFIRMGSTYKERFKGDICNHRIRTTFKNTAGHRFFVEFSSNMNDEGFHCTFSQDIEREERQEKGIFDNQPYHPSKQLERKTFTQQFSDKNLLSLINREFDCNYTHLEVDKYTLRPDDYISEC